MLRVNQLIGFGKILGGAVPLDITYLESRTSDSVNPSFSTVDFGAEHEERLIYLVVGAGGSTNAGNITQILIGGVTAQKKIETSSFSIYDVEIWSAEVPTGTSGTIAVTGGSNLNRISISAYRVIGPVIEHDTAAGIDSSPINLSVVAGGAALAGMCQFLGSGNLTGVDNDYSSTHSSAILSRHGHKSISATTSINISTNDTASNSLAAISLVYTPPVVAPEVDLTFMEGRNASSADPTFAAVDFGDEASDREIIITLTGGCTTNPGTVSTVTIGGVAATRETGAAITFASGLGQSEVWHANVPTGTSGDIVVAASNNVNRWTMAVYRMTGGVIFDVAETGGTSMSIDVEAGGAVMACDSGWTGTVLITAGVDFTYSANLSVGDGWHGSRAYADAELVSITRTSGSNRGMVAVSVSLAP